MSKSTPAKLKYMAEYEKRPENEKERVARNRARRHAVAAGTVKVGDGKEIDHVKPLKDGGSGKDSNTRVTTAAVNRGWRKGESGYDPGKQKK